MRSKQHGSLQLIVLLSLLAITVCIAFTVIYFLDKATLNRIQTVHQSAAKQSEQQVRPMMVNKQDNSQKKPLSLNEALELLDQPELPSQNTLGQSGVEKALPKSLVPESETSSTDTPLEQ